MRCFSSSYKLDHSQQQMPAMAYLLTTPGSTASWLTDMATAAQRHGVAKQYGGHISSGFLHSVTLPNSNQARVSDDYIPGLTRPHNACTPGVDARTTSPQGNILLGRDTLYPWAVGLRPYKDAFFSGTQNWSATTCFMSAKGPESTGYTKPEWWGLQEKYPELNVVVSSLTAGPIAPGDGAGDIDCQLVARTCRADAVLLKPDHPQFIIDPWWLGAAFGPVEGMAYPQGEVTQTSTCMPLDSRDASGAMGEVACWGFVLSAALTSPYTVTPESLDAAVGQGTGYAWSRRYGEPFGTSGATAFRHYNATQPLALALPVQTTATGGWGNYTYWRTAPTSCGGRGWTLLGELEKIISMSPQRVTSIAAGSCDTATPSLKVSLVGAPGEQVRLTFLSPSAVLAQSVVRISANGRGTVVMPPK